MLTCCVLEQAYVRLGLLLEPSMLDVRVLLVSCIVIGSFCTVSLTAAQSLYLAEHDLCMPMKLAGSCSWQAIPQEVWVPAMNHHM